MAGSPADPDRALRVAVQRLVRPGDPALRRRWPQLVPASATTSATRASRASTSGTTARCARGSSPASGTSSRRRPTRDMVYAGVQDAALFKTTDGGDSWHELPACASTASGPEWQPGAGGMCLHTIVLDPADENRMTIAISAAGVFRTDDGGSRWAPINQGLLSDGIPSPAAEVGHCVHNLAMHPTIPTRCTCRSTGTSCAATTGRPLVRDQRQPADRLRLPDRRPRARARDGLRRADHQRLAPLPARGQAAGLPQPHRRQRVGAAHRRAAAGELLRQRAARRDGDRHAAECGVYFGTTGGQVYASADSGDTWAPIVRDLPPVLSVEVQTLS